MGKRIVVGGSLAVLLIVLLVADAWLAARPVAQIAPLPGLDLGPWLCDGAICTLVVLVLTVAATHELVHLARRRGHHPFGRTAQVFAAVLVVGPYVSLNLSPITGGYDESWGLLMMAIALGCLFLFQAVLHKTANAMENLAITIFIIFYTGGLASFMTKLRMEIGGSAGVVALMFSAFLVKMTDTGAYFVGRAIGRRRLIPWLSPMKTWEGLIGGMVVTVLCALGVGLWLDSSGLLRLRNPAVPLPAALLLLGLLLGLFSAAGDLCASLLKRDAAVKDSGQTLPGLGGVLDVVDSPLLAAPVAWLFWTRAFHVLTQP